MQSPNSPLYSLSVQRSTFERGQADDVDQRSLVVNAAVNVVIPDTEGRATDAGHCQTVKLLICREIPHCKLRTVSEFLQVQTDTCWRVQVYWNSAHSYTVTGTINANFHMH
jgi:hypothetical protein